MNQRQSKFCSYYVESGNATESAKRAGYSEKTAYSIGNRLLKNDEIKKFIDSQQKKILNECETTPKTVINEVWKMYHTSKSESIKLRALEMLGRHCGCWLSVRDILHELTDDELRTLIDRLDEKIKHK